MKLVQKRLLGKQEPGYISHKANMHRYMHIDFFKSALFGRQTNDFNKDYRKSEFPEDAGFKPVPVFSSGRPRG